MVAIIACKLPHGLTIVHKNKRMTLRGANIGEDLENVSRNGRPNDNVLRAAGFGLTYLDNDGVELFNDWSAAVTYKGGKKANGKLDFPFVALENGSILGPFESVDEARRECGDLSPAIKTGTEGLEPENESTGSVKIETDKDSPASMAPPPVPAAAPNLSTAPVSPAAAKA